MKSCQYCSYYSYDHHACFHPQSWSQGAYFKKPGNPDVLNWDNNCAWYDPESPAEVADVQPVGRSKCQRFLSRFFSRFRRSK